MQNRRREKYSQKIRIQSDFQVRGKLYTPNQIFEYSKLITNKYLLGEKYIGNKILFLCF